MFYQPDAQGVVWLVKWTRLFLGLAVVAPVVAVGWWATTRGVEYQLGRFSFAGRAGLETEPSGRSLRGQDFYVRVLEREPDWVKEPSPIVVDGIEGKKTSTSVFAPVAGGTPGQEVRDHYESYWFPSLGTGAGVYYRTFGDWPNSWRDFTSRRWAGRIFATLRIRRE